MNHPRYLSNAEQIRKADQVMLQDYDYPSLLLMESAGRQCAEWLLRCRPEAEIYYVLAGPGNNGGDGLVIARYLKAAGKQVAIQFSADPVGYTGDALLNYKALKGAEIPTAIWPETCAALLVPAANVLYIDALLGTGITQELRGSIAEMIASLSELQLQTIAIDLPSGLDASTGFQRNAVLPAQATLTFQCAKVCHLVHPAAASCGEIVTLDIGIWPKVMARLGIRRTVLDGDWAAQQYRQRSAQGHKGTFGHAICVGGSKAYAGAIGLTGMAALQAGAGLSTVFTVEQARCAVYAGRPELMVQAPTDSEWLDQQALPALQASLHGKSALALGPGLGNEPASCNFVQGLLQAWARPLVIDADGLNVLASEPELWRYVPQGSILTPHPGEMARLLPGFDVMHKRLEAAEQLAQVKQVTVVLKGAGTIVALPNGKTFVNTSGNNGMATGGAGDVLTGIIVGLLAQGYAPDVAAPLGVYLHGLAGDMARAELAAAEAVTATEISNKIGKAFASLVEGH